MTQNDKKQSSAALYMVYCSNIHYATERTSVLGTDFLS